MTCMRLGDELSLDAPGFICGVILNSEFCLLTPFH